MNKLRKFSKMPQTPTHYQIRENKSTIFPNDIYLLVFSAGGKKTISDE